MSNEIVSQRSTACWLPLSAITERLPVRRLSPAGIQRFQQSLQQVGFLEQFPLVVLRLGEGTYQLLDGHHRYEAACRVGLEAVACVVKTHLSEQERYTLALRSNRAAEAVVPSTLVTYAEFIWARTPTYTQAQIAEMLGWSRDKVAKYDALQKICAHAWERIVTTFEQQADAPQEEGGTAYVTTVTFTEGLLRSLLDLLPEQQIELVNELLTNQDFSKGKFKMLAERYRLRNQMDAYAAQQIGDLGEPSRSQLREEVFSGAYDEDWNTTHRPRLTRLLTSLREEWERKNCLYLMEGDFSVEVTKVGTGSVDLILTDPPYYIARDNTFELEGRANISQDFGAWDKQTFGAVLEKMTVWATQWARILRPQGSGYVFTSDRFLSHLRAALETAGLHVKATLVWHKTNPGTQVVKTNFKSSVEYLLFFTNGESGHTFHWQGETEMHNFLESPICAGKERLIDAKGNTLHPTQKPESICRHLITISSNRGDTVFDGFAGTGTSGKVARDLGRKFIGIEQDPRYFAAMQRRLTQ